VINVKTRQKNKLYCTTRQLLGLIGEAYAEESINRVWNPLWQHRGNRTRNGTDFRKKKG
jgi:hypothetical protein